MMKHFNIQEQFVVADSDRTTHFCLQLPFRLVIPELHRDLAPHLYHDLPVVQVAPRLNFLKYLDCQVLRVVQPAQEVQGALQVQVLQRFGLAHLENQVVPSGPVNLEVPVIQLGQVVQAEQVQQLSQEDLLLLVVL